MNDEDADSSLLKKIPSSK